jgi:hypothetical protein
MSLKLKELLQTAWKNKGQIMEGFYNAYVGASDEVKAEALRRLEICRTNQCGLHDPKGQSERAVFKGKESCGGCGCDLYAKAHAMSAHCYLKDQQTQKFRQLIFEGYIQTLQDGFIKPGEDAPLSAEHIASLSTASDPELWLVLQALRVKGYDPPVGQGPLWDDVMTLEQEMEINKIAYKKQFERRNQQSNG